MRAPRGSTAVASPHPVAAVDPGSAARLVALEPGFYAFTLAGAQRWRDPAIGLPLPAIHVCAAAEGGLEITDEAGRAGSWLGGGSTMLFVKSRRGGEALVTAFFAREPEAPAVEVEIRRLDTGDDRAIRAVPAADGSLPPWMTVRLGAADDGGGTVRLDVVAHIRGRGDVRFAGGGVIGRLGPGLWIEAFTIGSPDPALAAAIEYKGLSASGAETPWLACGETCGESDGGVPLLGFAVRQKAAAAGAGRFDCEYTGYFQSGAVIGPLRNGAPCLSPRDNDPLEGMTLNITPR
jgi:hypothetical protein